MKEDMRGMTNGQWRLIGMTLAVVFGLTFWAVVLVLVLALV